MGAAAQQFAHALLLYSSAFSMNDAHRGEARLQARVDVIFDQGRQVLRPERVQIDYVFYRDSDRLHGAQHDLVAIDAAGFPSAVPPEWPP
jgi:hypothetical protein